MGNGMFTVAAAFGNVHGVYAPGNVELKPDILHNTQAYISEKLGGEDKKPTFFVFHVWLCAPPRSRCAIACAPLPRISTASMCSVKPGLIYRTMRHAFRATRCCARLIICKNAFALWICGVTAVRMAVVVDSSIELQFFIQD